MLLTFAPVSMRAGTWIVEADGATADGRGYASITTVTVGPRRTSVSVGDGLVALMVGKPHSTLGGTRGSRAEMG